VSSPALTTSAIPARRSASGSVASKRGSMTLTSGQWKAPTRFLPSGRLTAVFPPIAASTRPTSVVGTATHRIPRRKAAAANPAASVVQPPPNATMIPSRSSRRSRPAPLVEPPEALLVPRQRPPTAANAAPRRRRIDVDPHRQRLLAQRPPDARRLDRAAPERQNRRPLVLERLDRRVSLEHAELGLP